MKALSIRQPWAWAVIHAGKDVENRDWMPGGMHLREARRLQNSDILIHAGKSMTRAEYDEFREFFERQTFGHPVKRAPDREALQRGGIIGIVRFVGVVNPRVSDYASRPDLRPALSSCWFFGPYGLVFANPRPLTFAPCKGALGFFDIPNRRMRKAFAA